MSPPAPVENNKQQQQTSSSVVVAAPSLNLYKKIAVIRKPNDSLTYEDVEGNVKTVSVEQLGDAIATATPLVTPKLKLDIPVPRIVDVESYQRDVPRTFQVPRSYVRSHRLTQEEWNETLEYVADAEDEAWLDANSKFGGAANDEINGIGQNSNDEQQQHGSSGCRDEKEKSGTTTTTTKSTRSGSVDGSVVSVIQRRHRPQLTLGMLERMMDALEKETAFEAIITTSQAEAIFRIKIPQLYAMFPVKATSSARQHGASSIIIPAAKHVVNDVYSYWVQKRSKLKRPLLRRFWPVTSTDDTNPHLVFRPREKEKYKLRKKRQNDMDAFKKLKHLRNDFDTLRSVLELVQRREELGRLLVQLQIDRFQQRLYDAVDTSGQARVSKQLKRDDVEQLLAIPSYFETQSSASSSFAAAAYAGGGGVNGRNKANNKRSRAGMMTTESTSALLVGSGGGGGGSGPTGGRGGTHAAASAASLVTGGMAVLDPASGNIIPTTAAAVDCQGAVGVPLVVAGHNHGEPAPNFMQPLNSRQSFVSSWEGAVPHVTTYVDAQSEPTFRFRHRPRVGRGGRICIDRLPCPPSVASIGNPATAATAPVTVLIAGKGMIRSSEPKARLLDLLPRPLDHDALSRRVEEMCIAAIREDTEARSSSTMLQATNNTGSASAAGASDVVADENDGDEIIVNLDDWLDTDDQIWGEERHVIGPI